MTDTITIAALKALIDTAHETVRSIEPILKKLEMIKND